MATVTVIEFSGEEGDRAYQASCGDLRGSGRTPGEALDAVAALRDGTTPRAIYVLSDSTPDEFFTDEQRERLALLMDQWRDARDRGSELPAELLTELQTLMHLELAGAGERAKVLADFQSK